MFLFVCFCFGRCCAQLHAYLAAASRTHILMPRIGSRRARTDEPPAPVGVQRELLNEKIREFEEA